MRSGELPVDVNPRPVIHPAKMDSNPLALHRGRQLQHPPVPDILHVLLGRNRQT